MEKLQALKKQAEELAKAVKAAEEAEKQAKEQAWKTYERKYSYECKFSRAMRSDPIALHIRQTPVEDEELQRLESQFGPMPFKEVHHSVGYIRDEEGILSHIGGGYLILEDGVPISQEDWELLKAGDLATITKHLHVSKW